MRSPAGVAGGGTAAGAATAAGGASILSGSGVIGAPFAPVGSGESHDPGVMAPPPTERGEAGVVGRLTVRRNAAAAAAAPLFSFPLLLLVRALCDPPVTGI